MIKIQINKGIDPSKFVKGIRLGNGVTVKFKSKREAIYFISETNRFLMKALVVCNDIITFSYEKYRRLWFTALNQSGRKTNYMSLVHDIKKEHDAAVYIFEKFFSPHWKSSQDMFFSFIDIKKVLISLELVLSQMADHFHKINRTMEYYETRAYCERAFMLRKQIESLGAEHSVNVPLPDYKKLFEKKDNDKKRMQSESR